MLRCYEPHARVLLMRRRIARTFIFIRRVRCHHSLYVDVHIAAAAAIVINNGYV